MSNDITPRLPVPARLEPRATARTLMHSTRALFYALWNGADATFRNLLASVGNDDAITGNRMFDRHEAITLMRKAAEKQAARDLVFLEAKAGDIYRCLVRILRDHDLGLKIRREQFNRLTHDTPPSAPAE